MFLTDTLDADKQQLRDTARLSLQATIAAVITFYIMRIAELPEMFIGVLSAVIVIQPSVGNALHSGLDRLLSTIVGSALGIACFMLLPGGYGTAAALGLSVLALHVIAGFKPEWRYGVVAAIALSLGAETNAWQAATDRCIALGVGVVIGLMVSFIVWPDSAGGRARRHMKRALKATVHRLNLSVEDAQTGSEHDQDKFRRQFHTNMASAKEAADHAVGDTELLFALLDNIEKLYNSALILNRVAEETDSAAGDDEKFRQEAGECREIAENMVERIIDGEKPDDDSPEQFRSCLDRLRERAANRDCDPRDHVLQNAMVFGLGEVGDSLEELIEAIGSK